MVITVGQPLKNQMNHEGKIYEYSCAVAESDPPIYHHMLTCDGVEVPNLESLSKIFEYLSVRGIPYREMPHRIQIYAQTKVKQIMQTEIKSITFDSNVDEYFTDEIRRMRELYIDVQTKAFLLNYTPFALEESYLLPTVSGWLDNKPRILSISM